MVHCQKKLALFSQILYNTSLQYKHTLFITYQKGSSKYIYAFFYVKPFLTVLKKTEVDNNSTASKIYIQELRGNFGWKCTKQLYSSTHIAPPPPKKKLVMTYIS